MKDKHINIPEHSLLHKALLYEVHRELNVGGGRTERLLCIKGAVYACGLILAYAALFLAHTPLMLAAAYVIYGIIAVLVGFNFAHDFSHNTIFRNKALNNACFTALYTLLGAHAEAWKHRHVHSHHYAPNVKDYDTDLQITSLIRVEPGSPLRWFHRYQHIYAPLAYTSYSLFWVFIKDFRVYFGGDGPSYKRTLRYHLSFWLQKLVYIGYLLAVPLLFSGQSVWTILTAFVLMHLVQSLFLLFTFFMTHHVEKTEYFEADEGGFIPTSWLANQVRSSNDFYPFSTTANFIFGGFNYHIAHHLFPHIHHVHYPRLNRVLYRVLVQHGMQPNVTTYFGGAIAHLRHLRRMSR
jgi:linoleoyl-CoA desaturase